MNNFAVSSDGIATALQDSASALMEAGASLEESVALVAAANRVVQDPNSVGSALRTISLRLRGTSVEVLEEMGEETDGMVESVSKMQEKLKALTGVDILTDANAYKSPFAILSEIGKVWQDLDSLDQAAALELMAGKNRANTLAAILNNMKDLEGAYESALNAEGSALKENETYMDSIQGRIDQFTNAVQTMWMKFIDSNVLKFIIDLGTGVIKLITDFGALETIITGVLTYLSVFSKNKLDFSSMVFGEKGFARKIGHWIFDPKEAVGNKKNDAPKLDVDTSEIDEKIANAKQKIDDLEFEIEHPYSRRSRKPNQNEYVYDDSKMLPFGTIEEIDDEIVALTQQKDELSRRRDELLAELGPLFTSDENGELSLGVPMTEDLTNSFVEFDNVEKQIDVINGKLIDLNNQRAELKLGYDPFEAFEEAVNSPLEMFNTIDQVDRELEELQKRRDKLSKAQDVFGVDLSDQLEDVDNKMIDLNNRRIEIETGVDMSAFEAFKEEVDSLSYEPIDIPLEDPASDAKLAQLNAAKEELASLQAQREAMINGMASDTVSGAVPQIQAEINAYQSMFKVLDEVKKTKLSIGDELDAASKIDQISNAAQNGQVALFDYMSALGDGNEALRAYVASVDDGNYSMAGFKQFIQQHNASLQQTSIKYKLASVGAQLFNAAVSMGISLLAGWAIEKLYTAIDNYIHRVEYLKEEVQELTDTFQDTKKELSENIETLTVSSDTESYSTLLDEFEELTKGVNKYGENISLTTDQYERYKEICEAIVGVNPSIAAGYDSATEAIGNNAGALAQLIELQKEQARLNAAEFIGYGAYANNGNFEKMAQNAINEVTQANENLHDVVNDATVETDLYDVLPSIFGLDALNPTQAQDIIRNTMEVLGYTQDEINKALSEAVKSVDIYDDASALVSSMNVTDFNKWLSDYAGEILSSNELMTKLESDLEWATIESFPVEERIKTLEERMSKEQEGTEKYKEMEDKHNKYLKLSVLESVKSEQDMMNFLVQQMGYSRDAASEEIDKYVQYDSLFDRMVGAVTGYDSDKFISDYTDKVLPDAIDRSAEEIEGEIAAIRELSDAYVVEQANLEAARDSMVDVFLQVPHAVKGYEDLGNESQSFITEWIKNSPLFKVDDNSTQDSIVAAKQTIINTINGILNDAYTTDIEVDGKTTTVTAKTLIDSLFSIDTSDIDYSQYKTDVQTLITRLWDAIGGDGNELGFEDKNALAIGLGFEFVFDEDPAIAAFKEDVARIVKNEMTPEEIEQWINSLGYSELQALLKIDWDVEAADSLTLQEMINKAMPKVAASESVVTVSTYSALAEGVASYKEVLAQTSEIVSDNTKITQEYRDAIDELGISETLLNECFDENDKLMVKDAKQLNKLVKGAKKNTAQNIKLAKSQAKLEYYELYKQMRDLTRGLDYTSEGYAILTDEQHAQIDALYNEMNAVQSAIAQFSVLEVQLLGAASAYEKFAEAQTIDEENDYSSQAASMVETLATAFNTGALGTESARAAMLALVPEEVYANLDTVEEKMDAIAKYFNEGELSKYFSIEFDDDGNVSNVEATIDDLKEFVANGVEKGVFTGNWEHFDIAEDITSLEQFAEAMGITEEVAFALFEALENHDAGNLFDPSNILDKFMSGDIEYQAYENAKAMADLQYQLANGAISAEEYAAKMVGLDGQLAAGAITKDEYNAAIASLKEQLKEGTITQWEYNNAVMGLSGQQEQITEDAYKQATAYAKKTETLEKLNKKLAEYQKQLETGKDSDGNVVDKKQVYKNIESVVGQIGKLQEELELLGEPTPVTIELAIEKVQGQIDDFKTQINELANSGDTVSINVQTAIQKVEESDFNLESLGLTQNSDGTWSGVAKFLTSMGLSDDEGTVAKVTEYLNLVDTQHTLDVMLGSGVTTVESTLENILTILQAIADKLGADYTLDVKTNLNTSAVDTWMNKPLSKTISVGIKKVGNWLSGLFADGTVHANGTAHASGTAFKSGSWGAPKTETALVGELGPEIVVRNGRWTTVGDNGAEFANIKKGDIIFNHKQTEDLLSKGYVTGRGKAYAEGTAYNGIYTYDKLVGNESKAYSNTSGSNISNASSKLSKAASDISKSSDKLSDDFKEIFDWIEVRIEEITEDLDLKSAKLENATGSTKQNSIIYDMIELNHKLYDNLTAGASKYYEFAKKLLAKVPEEYRDAAQDGSIAIESFVGTTSEATLEAIQDYREWVQKGADATQQAEETLTEISSLAKQAIDNIAADYENKTSLRDIKIEQYEAYNALLETDVGFESAKIYQAMIKENNKNITTLQEQRKKMQAELNAQVEAGNIKKYSQDWYDAVNDIAAVDTAIIELKTDTENWQDTINELHWDKLDLLISKLEAVSNEADNLLDILSNSDAVDEAGEWTKEGVTSLGLYAQQMEAAEVSAKRYQTEIKYLNSNWEKLGYTEQEYIEKLDELKSAQYDSIQAYHDAKDAIVDLNSERIDAIKDGIEKEIEAYEELINKKKEELDAEKDLYDFQKGVAEQEKDIAKIQRQLAALSADNSASARAKRAQLEAELSEAQAALEETYYERSVENQQTALDKELENFQEVKEEEMEGWDEYLENTEQVVADSLEVVKSNTDVIYQELKAMGQEYGLSITESLTSPWKEGENAIQSFSEKFGITMSATVEELKALEAEYKAYVTELEQAGSTMVGAVNDSASNYQAATKKEVVSSGNSSSSSSDSSSSAQSYPYGKASETTGNIKQGSKGNAVKAIQYALNELGYGNSGTKKVDGIFGSGTKSAVKAFQKATGISADGIVGKNTREKFKLKGYASGTVGVKKDQLAWIDELGEELVMHADGNGRLAFLSKGTSVLNNTLTDRIMNLAMDPQNMLDQNRPQIGLSPEIHNTEVNITMDIAEVVHIDKVTNDTIPDLTKAIEKQMDSYMTKVNNSLKKFVR